MLNKEEFVTKAYGNLSDRELYDINVLCDRIVNILIKSAENSGICISYIILDDKVRNWVIYKLRKESLYVKSVMDKNKIYVSFVDLF